MSNYYEIIKTEFKTTVDSVMMHVLYSLLPGTQGLQGKQLESIGIQIRAPSQSTPAQNADIPTFLNIKWHVCFKTFEIRN